jgi:hypothetical protein
MLMFDWSALVTPPEGHPGQHAYTFVICVLSTYRKQDPIYVFPEMKLRGLILYFHIYVSVSDLYTTIGPLIYCRKIGGLILEIYKSLKDT